MNNMTNASSLTSEERQVPLYQDFLRPTNPQDVVPDTPLDSLYLSWTEKQLPERERTKHVHRLHPYLGKYIPQLVEIFLRKYCSHGMTVLDPFSGSGTTLVQANELNINSIGCDISAFNILIGRVKTASYNLSRLQREVGDIMEKIALLSRGTHPSFFTPSDPLPTVDLCNATPYLRNWFAPQALEELLTFKAFISNYQYRDFLELVLSRAARSARLTTHFDLDFPKKPITEPYDCYKHSRTCSPTTTALKFLIRYSQDGLQRIKDFSRVRTQARVQLIHGDSRTVPFDPVDVVMTSPPYVGLIDYHEQHRYAFELLDLKENRDSEIGPATRGQSQPAKTAYMADILTVFRNAVSSLRLGGKLIVVAGDKFNLYPAILNNLDLVHDATLRRHVNRRTGRREGNFFESIFIYTKR